jgi:hypothetical protein
MIIALIKALLTVCTTLSVEKNLISEIDKPVIPLDIQHANITIGGTDNKTLTINPSANLESSKSYYIEMASSVLTDVAGNNFAGINNSSTWAINAASLSTTVAWSGANVDVTDGYINTSELSTATITGKITNLSNASGLSISEIKFFSTNSVMHTVSSALINAISIDTFANMPVSLLIATVCVPAGIFVIVVSMVTSEVS